METEQPKDFRATIRKSGNSYVVTIPKEDVDYWGLTSNDMAHLRILGIKKTVTPESSHTPAILKLPNASLLESIDASTKKKCTQPITRTIKVEPVEIDFYANRIKYRMWVNGLRSGMYTRPLTEEGQLLTCTPRVV